jgi:hypothetical protein
VAPVRAKYGDESTFFDLDVSVWAHYGIDLMRATGLEVYEGSCPAMHELPILHFLLEESIEIAARMLWLGLLAMKLALMSVCLFLRLFKSTPNVSTVMSCRSSDLC